MQSTDDGDANNTEIKYMYSSPARPTSGNNTLYYEYDKKAPYNKNIYGEYIFYRKVGDHGTKGYRTN